MTKKDFIVIARALRDARTKMLEITYESEMQWRVCVRTIANECEEQNPRFNREKFYTACQYQDDNIAAQVPIAAYYQR